MKLFKHLLTFSLILIGSAFSASAFSHIAEMNALVPAASQLMKPLFLGFAGGGFALQIGFDSTNSMAVLAYVGLTGRNGVEDNIGGTTKQFWFAPKSYFTTISKTKDLSDGTATLSELSEISDDHVFAVGKGFHKNYCTRDMGEVKYTGAGERDGRSIPGKATFFIPGLSINNLGILRMLKNDELIILAEAADGKILQLGSERFPAEVRISEGGTAKNESGVRGFMIEVDFFESGPQMYTGVIDEI